MSSFMSEIHYNIRPVGGIFCYVIITCKVLNSSLYVTSQTFPAQSSKISTKYLLTSLIKLIKISSSRVFLTKMLLLKCEKKEYNVFSCT